MALIEIEYGSLASSETMNSNFEYLDDEITSTNQQIVTVNTALKTLEANLNSSLETVRDDVDFMTSTVLRIGIPQLSLSNTLPDSCIWLEGAVVSRTTYSELFNIYGETYGEGDGSNTFQLPDFTGRVIWGGSSFGYLSAGLPNITGYLTGFTGMLAATPSGAFYAYGSAQMNQNAGSSGSGLGFSAANSSSIYGNSSTVQPPAIKVRVYTRYE